MTELAQIVIGGLLQGMVFATVALGFSLVYRVTGIVNLAQGAFCALGALAMYSFQQTLGWPAPLAALAAVAGTAAFGAALGAVSFVPALGRLPNSSMLMLTAALLTLIEGIALLVWGSQPYAAPPFSGERPVALLGVPVPPQGFWIAGASALIALATWYGLTRTTAGKALRACAENPVAARLMGIDVARSSLASFALAAMIGAISGVVVGPIISFEFDTGRIFTISGFIAMAIGGMGSFLGAIVGGLFLGVAEQLAAGYVSSLFANGLSLALLIFVMILRPQGLFGAGLQPRQDTRQEQRVYHKLVRLKGREAAVLAVLSLAFFALLPWALGPSGLLASFTIAGILFIAVLGLDVLMGYAGQVSLGQAGFMAIGGYAAAILATSYGWPPLIGTLVAMALSVACALLLSLATMRLRGLYLALATLAFGLLVDSLTVGLFGLTGGPSGLVGIPSFSIGSVSFGSPFAMYYLVMGLAAVLTLALAGGMHSAFGRALKAVRTDQTAAAALGINVARHKMAAFAISAALGSLAGSLYAFQFHFLSPEMVGTSRSFEMIAMLVIGGEGTLVGSWLGVALLTLLPSLFQPLALYMTFAQGLLMALAFLYLPEGMFGAAVSWLARRERANASSQLVAGFAKRRQG